MLIRPAGALDLPPLPGIESAAGAVFADIGMVEIADEAAPTVEGLTRYQQAGRAWVAVDDGDQPVTCLIADLVDGFLHIEPERRVEDVAAMGADHHQVAR